MIASINQPAYLPWLGYFERIAASDVHVVLDHVQFEKNSFTNRNKIRTTAGPTWLTVPVLTAGRFGSLAINAVEIDPTSGWAEKHWKTLEQSYRKAPFFDDHAAFLEDVYLKSWVKLIDLCRALTRYLLDALQITTPIRYSSEIAHEGAKDMLVLSLCEQVGADIYLSGPLGRQYLREPIFTGRGIAVRYHDYNHPTYPQIGSRPFDPNLSILDLLFNCGPDSRAVLTRTVTI
jgi:hypothetical protein